MAKREGRRTTDARDGQGGKRERERGGNLIGKREERRRGDGRREGSTFSSSLITTARSDSRAKNGTERERERGCSVRLY